jgi:dienelactone hydrolase
MRETCTITISGGDILTCAGQEVTASAVLTCGEGYEPVNDPQWFLGNLPIGTGTEVTFTPGEGVYPLIVRCGSCEDQVVLTVLSAAACTLTPGLDAAFSIDSTEATTGVFLQVNPEPVNGGNFGELKFLMRPVTLSADDSLSTGQFSLSATGDSIEVFQTDGTPVPLPAAYDVTALPVTLLVNGPVTGEANLVFTYVGGGSFTTIDDVVKFRIGPFPGLAGGELAGYPFFEFVAAINDSDDVMGAVDPSRHAERTGLPYRAYVVAHKTPAEWAADNSLTDVSGGFEAGSVTAGSIAGNTLNLWTTGLTSGTDLGLPFDVVYDFGQDGALDPGDLVDGLSDTEAGFYVVRDLNRAGPHATLVANYTGGTFLGQRTYYPADIGTMGTVPLIVISHGNGHLYTWYDYLGTHLASYGYVVMSHQNNTQPGIESASTTTLTNTDFFLAHMDTIAGGDLNGHIDDSRIVWVGHSRGGEGVVRAYDRVYDGTYIPANFTVGDITCISSIAPTCFLGTSTVNAHEVDYHMIAGSADGDVHGGADNPIAQHLRLPQAARGNTQVTYVQGADHNDFNCCGTDDAIGPNPIGRAQVQILAKSFFLALVKLYTENNVPARDYFTRMYAGFHPSGIADTVVVASMYREALDTSRFVIDNFQTETGTGTSSSGGAVTFDVSNINEGTLDDNNTSFTWLVTDPMNGMTQASAGDAYAGGTVFDWTVGQHRYYEVAIVPGEKDFSDDGFLSFRACQGTRHPETVGLAGTLTFTVSIRDSAGTTSSIDFDSYGALTRPYLRGGLGTGFGWANEFNTVRIRLADFENDGSGIDLKNIVAVRFDFGTGYGSARGRIGIDDVELTQN